MPQVNALPALTAVHPDGKSATWVGRYRSAWSPTPSWPRSLPPQHHSVVSVLMPQVCEAPADTAVHSELNAAAGRATAMPAASAPAPTTAVSQTVSRRRRAWGGRTRPGALVVFIDTPHMRGHGGVDAV